ncbi:MAG: LysM peptidoglycan-binding domain-containing protein [Muribaculaceae bacterium]|nr:LysM peptidoglycan-binding domain-containing protein [Muribaculaceae bacterium]
MNRNLKKTVATLILYMTAIMAMAQDMPVSSLPITTINGQQYHYYEVQPKETIYSISHKLGVNKQTIEQYNPTIKDGIRNHSIIYFPVSEDTNPIQIVNTENSAIVHKAKKGESAYAIAHQYGVSVADLVAANPNILDGVKAKDSIIIPSTADSTQTTKPEDPTKPQHTPPSSLMNRILSKLTIS